MIEPIWTSVAARGCMGAPGYTHGTIGNIMMRTAVNTNSHLNESLLHHAALLEIRSTMLRSVCMHTEAERPEVRGLIVQTCSCRSCPEEGGEEEVSHGVYFFSLPT